MKRNWLLLIAVALVSPCVCAQPGMSPPAELKKLDHLVGSWEGSGTWCREAGGEDLPWTAVETTRKILGGHCIQTDSRIEGEGMPGALMFRTVYWYDEPTERFRYVTLSNAGPPDDGTLYLLKDGTMVQSSANRFMGEPVTTQTVSRPRKDGGYDFVIQESVGGAPFFDHVTGSMKPGKKTFSIAGSEKAVLMPAPEEMAKCAGHLGSWNIKGKVSPMPGMPPMEVTGREEIRPALGGHVHLAEVHGDPVEGMPAYEAHSYLAWGPEEKAFRRFVFSNMGESMIGTEHHVADDTIVSFYAGVAQGVPQAERTVVHVKDKNTLEITSVSLAGANEPTTAFEGVMTRVQKDQ